MRNWRKTSGLNTTPSLHLSLLSICTWRIGAYQWAKQQAATLAATAGSDGRLPPALTTAHESLLRFQSKQGQAFIHDKIKEEKMRGILRTGQGVAFAFEPASGAIEPWDVVEIKVHVFTGMCGRYQDEAVLKLGDGVATAPEQRIRLRAGVLGSPLRISHDTVGMSFAAGALGACVCVSS